MHAPGRRGGQRVARRGPRSAVRGTRDMHDVTNSRGARRFVAFRGQACAGRQIRTADRGMSPYACFSVISLTTPGGVWGSTPAGGWGGQHPPPRTIAPARPAVRRWDLGDVARDLHSRTLPLATPETDQPVSSPSLAARLRPVEAPSPAAVRQAPDPRSIPPAPVDVTRPMWPMTTADERRASESTSLPLRPAPANTRSTRSPARAATVRDTLRRSGFGTLSMAADHLWSRLRASPFDGRHRPRRD
jgi:hypothetical protein